MKCSGMAIAVGTLFCLSAAAQSQTGAQAGAQSSGQASVQAGQTQAQASGNASAASAASAQNEQANASLASGTAFNAALSSPIDSKKCKPGDPVNAKTTEAAKSEGKTVIPKGSKLVGHVTQASARAKGDPEERAGSSVEQRRDPGDCFGAEQRVGGRRRRGRHGWHGRFGGGLRHGR